MLDSQLETTADSSGTQSVLLFLKWNITFFGYFDPEQVSLDNQNEWFSGRPTYRPVYQLAKQTHCNQYTHCGANLWNAKMIGQQGCYEVTIWVVADEQVRLTTHVRKDLYGSIHSKGLEVRPDLKSAHPLPQYTSYDRGMRSVLFCFQNK